MLSHTVAASICTYVSLGALPSTAIGTAEMTEKFDFFFDCGNSSTLNSMKPLKSALCSKGNQKEYIREAMSYIEGLQVFHGEKEVTSRIKCLKGWLLSLSCILHVWEHLKMYHNFEFLLTRRLNTDPLENFFGTIRQQGGNCDTPTPTQFTHAFRKLFFSSFLTTSTGNCAADFDQLLADVDTKSKKHPLVIVANKPITLDTGTTDYKDNLLDENILQDNAIAYVAGYLLQKCLVIHSCSACVKAVQSKILDAQTKLFCHFKAYDCNKGDFGVLHTPSDSFLEYIKKLEKVFLNSFSTCTKSLSVGRDILEKFHSVPISYTSCEKFPQDFLKKLFLRLRIFYALKFANRNLVAAKRKNRKYVKVTHL